MFDQPVEVSEKHCRKSEHLRYPSDECHVITTTSGFGNSDKLTDIGCPGFEFDNLGSTSPV